MKTLPAKEPRKALMQSEGECLTEMNEEAPLRSVCAVCYKPLVRKFRDIDTGHGRYDLYFCRDCNTGVVSPMPAEEELENLYSSGSYRTAQGKRFNFFIEFLIYLSRVRRKQRIKKYKNSGSLLDIGCGRGLFLGIMKKDGWLVAGVEYDRETALSISAEYNVPVASGGPSGWEFPEGSFEVITLNHVLEHTRNPESIIEKCRDLLKKDGLIVCTTPNFSSIQAVVGKELWFHLDLPYHLYHFSEKGLIKLLRKHSFRVVRVRRFDIEYDPFGWLQTLLNRSGTSRNYLYDRLKRPGMRMSAPAGAAARDLFVTLLLTPFYMPLALLLALFESFVLKRGGSVTVFAERE